ncbi:MAG: S8 family serine peptidase [Candidatus Cryptobacteroides sp.]
MPLEESGTSKVLALSEEHDRKSFLVKFTSTPPASLVAEMEAGGIGSIRPLFRSTPGKEELEKRFGLDRWYEVSVGEDADFDLAVAEVAAMPEVGVVELCCRAVRASDCVAYPYFPDIHISTKSEDEPAYPFDDPSLPAQWNYINTGDTDIATKAQTDADIDIRDVWTSLCCGDPSIIVAVIDDGVKYTHPDLRDNMWVNEAELNGREGVDDDGNGYIDDIYGYNFCSDSGAISWDSKDDIGHGTHCAGTIAAVNNNGTGVCGVAGGSGKSDGCRLMSCQILSGYDSGSGSTDKIARAIKYAADMGASVMSCSFGYALNLGSDNAYIKTVGSAEIDAIHYFEACAGNNPVLTDGNIAIFASGNSSYAYAQYPGAYHDIISVSAFGPDFLPTYYTNYGPGCNISAPGGERSLGQKSEISMVLSTGISEKSGSDYVYMEGTSMACPHVSGVVAVALSYAKKLGKTFTVKEFKDIILTSVKDIDSRIDTVRTKTYTRNALPPMSLSKFSGKMGTGAIDAWRLMMQVEGIPCLSAAVGMEQLLDITEYFGESAASLTFTGVEVEDGCRVALGLEDSPYIDGGRLVIRPTRTGAGKIRVRAISGGTALGGGDNIGGMEIVREVGVIARSVRPDNGGWL